MAELKQSNNNGLLVGTLVEKNLEVKDAEANGKPCKAISGSISVKNDKGTFTLSVYSKSITSAGEKNKLYANYEALMNDFVSELDASKVGSSADVVSCKFKPDVNDYPSKDGSRMVTTTRFRLTTINHASADEEEVSDVEFEGYIANIKDEVVVKNEEEVETGRNLVDMMCVGYNETPQPFTFVVKEDMVEAFEDIYEKGQCCKLTCELVMRHIGGEPKKAVAFGRAAKTSSGYDKLELVVVGGNAPYEIDDDDYMGFALTDKQFKELAKQRKTELEQKLKEKQEEAKTGKIEKKPIAKKKTIEEENNDFDDLDDIF